MSILCEATNSEGMEETTFTTTPDDDGTFAIYFYLTALPAGGSYRPIFQFYIPSNFTGYGVYVDSNGKYVIRDDNADTISSPGSATVSINTWYKIWVRAQGVASSPGPVDVYHDGSTSSDLQQVGVSLGTTNTVVFQLGTNAASYTTDYYFDGSLFNAKYWQADRAASEANSELTQYAFINAGLARWKLDVFSSGLNDESGGGRNLSAIGTLSTGQANPWTEGIPYRFRLQYMPLDGDTYLDVRNN